MRLIGTFHDESHARKFCAFLKEKKVEHTLDLTANTDWGSEHYGTHAYRIWITREDDVAQAIEWMQDYQNDPNSAQFQLKNQSLAFLSPKTPTPTSENEETLPPPGLQLFGIITLYLILGCGLLFLFGQMSAPEHGEVPPELREAVFITSPINKALLYDYPKAYELLDQAVTTYGFKQVAHPSELPAAGRSLVEKYNQTPYWDGFYGHLVSYLKDPKTGWNFNAPLFEKIRQGELWRAFTPALLHANIFHLLFNMLWLLIIGRQMELRIGVLRYLLFILIAGIVTNTAQYLMSGPNFLGFSGVVFAMIGFIWVRIGKAPWEGYQLHPSTFVFIAFFVLLVLTIQLIGFFTEIYTGQSFTPPIANTAHLVGALFGYFCGKTELFAVK